MRLFFTTLALSACFALAQDSPIIINDNGNVPIELKDRKQKPTIKSRRPMTRAKTNWSYYETHIYYDGPQGIQQNGASKEIFIEEPGYKAVCFQDTDGKKYLLAGEEPWTFTTKSMLDSSVIRLIGPNHVRIDMGRTMQYNPPNDLDDPDPTGPNGKRNQLNGGVFSGAHTPNHPSGYRNGFVIHYCGPQGCKDDYGKDQCKGAKPMSIQSGAKK